MESCVRGHRFIKMFGEVLQCTRELENTKDRYAVAVVRRSTVVGYIPRKIAAASALFLERKELFVVKSLVHSVILKIYLKVGWRYLAN